MASPYASTPHPWARAAAEVVMQELHEYMHAHPESELHRQGKMFGVLVIKTDELAVRTDGNAYGYLKAFSSILDGRHTIEGFVPPIFDFTDQNGYFRHEEAKITALTDQPEQRKQRSQALQRWLFSQYRILSSDGESKDLIAIFEREKPILSAEAYFLGQRETADHLPPAGSGECCGPKLLQYAFQHGYKPLAMAEFWVGATDTREMHQDGHFYGACSGKCRPILRHMLRGTNIIQEDESEASEQLAKKIRILYEDEYLIVALKPAGLLTVPGKVSDYSLEACLQQLRNLSFVKAAHRLDQYTSGIVVCAKAMSPYIALQKQFSSQRVKKRYKAIICLQDDHKIAQSGVIDLPILANPLDRPRQMVDLQYGKPAVTRYEVVKYLSQDRILIHLFPETGRTHQLRVHCAHPDGLNAPILGDRLYGQPANRLYLHASEITFTHPVTGSRMNFSDKTNWF